MRVCNPKIIGLTFGAGLAFAASTISASATTLTDGNFASVTATTFASGSTVGFSAPCASCGNGGGAGLQATFTSTTGGTSDVGFVDNALIYDPGTSGAIASINASYDRLVALTNLASVPFNFRLVIEQGGIDYVTAVNLGGADSGGA